MSLSVNNPTLATVARSHRHAELMDSKNCVKAGFGAPAPSSSGVAMRTDNLKFNSGDAAVSAGALTKLFDMLEAVFKSMREMFSGRDQSADRLVHNHTPHPHKPEGAVQPKTSDSPALPNTLLKANESPKAKLENSVLPKMVADSGKQPSVLQEKPLEQKASQLTGKALDKNASTSVPSALTGDAGKLSVEVKPQERSVIPGRPFIPGHPGVTTPHINVSNDSNAQIKVEVNVAPCPHHAHDAGSLVNNVQPGHDFHRKAPEQSTNEATAEVLKQGTAKVLADGNKKIDVQAKTADDTKLGVIKQDTAKVLAEGNKKIDVQAKTADDTKLGVIKQDTAKVLADGNKKTDAQAKTADDTKSGVIKQDTAKVLAEGNKKIDVQAKTADDTKSGVIKQDAANVLADGNKKIDVQAKTADDTKSGVIKQDTAKVLVEGDKKTDTQASTAKQTSSGKVQQDAAKIANQTMQNDGLAAQKGLKTPPVVERQDPPLPKPGLTTPGPA
ncbi:hypothetical protein [Pseudomonas trivialis]|uniref:hypothetical protein n=1 Tax=Pseudomonas trivialis TaxID=200450 RepID=UPI0011B08698|nr:hypothetical protein [Pseudomonas trivialis]